MKKTRFLEEQMVKILREEDEAPAEVAKRHGRGISRSTPGASVPASSRPWT
jgi:hypothetical protein